MTAHVEDILEILGNQAPGPSADLSVKIKLSRIDIKAVDGMIAQGQSMGLTEKQRGLTLHLIQKYRRQLAGVGVDIEPILADPQWRTGLRQIQPVPSTIWIEDNEIRFKFGYDAKLIERLHKASSSDTFMAELKYQGKGTKTWHLELNAEGINLAYGLAKDNKFTASLDLVTIFAELEQLHREQLQSYVSWDNGWQIHNAVDSQRVAAEAALSSTNNIDHQLVDLVHLGFDVDESVKLKLLETWQPREASIMIHRNFFIENKKFDTGSIIDFLDQLNTWPVVINYGWYNKFEKDVLPQLIQAFGHDKVGVEGDRLQDAKIWISKQLPDGIYNEDVQVPILVTYTGLMGQHSNKYSATPYKFKKVLHVEPPL